MRKTKNINITENALGFAINNNYITIKYCHNLNEAVIEGFKMAKNEKKGLVIKTFFVNIKRTTEQLSKIDNLSNWLMI